MATTINSKLFQTLRNCFLCCSVCLFIFAPCLICQKAGGQADETSRSWNRPVKPFRVIGDIYYVGASDVTTFLITTSEGHILLDSGFAETVPQIRQNIAALGFRLEDVKIIINSHAHYDHAGGLAELKELAGAKLFASRRDAALLADGGKSDFHFSDKMFHFAPVKADRILRDRETIKLGGVRMTAHLTPGHTKGCTTWTLKVRENGKNYDVVFVGSTTVPGGYKLVGNEKYPGIAADYVQMFRRLKKLPADVFLASHGSFFNLQEKIELMAANPDQNPFVDPKGYLDFIDRAEKTFQARLREQRRQKENASIKIKK